MPGTIPGSPILEFYNDAKIFITGGTGFLGKALIEKFLRVCLNIDHIYVFIRAKKNKDALARMKELFEDPLFDTLRKEKPDFEKKVTCIPGNITNSKLGMSDNDYNFLINEVTHVFHSAATVRFNEKLYTSVRINVLGTQEVLAFCNKCIRLKVFLHVSTAYSNCVRSVIGEDFYDPPKPAEKVLHLLEILGEDKINSLEEELIKPWPNTYSYTKAISEFLVKEYGKSIPTVLFRPAIVMGTSKEPVRGWVNNVYGPTGVIAAVGAGLMRVLYADESKVANIIPVDLTVNAIIACAWEGGNTFANNIGKNPEMIPKVYNFTVDSDNAITWGEFLKVNLSYGVTIPSKKAIWYYTITLTKFKMIYLSLIFFFHYIPAVIIDTALFLIGKKPKMVKTYNKIHAFSFVMVFFAINTWKFTDHNIKKLWTRLSDADKELFDFDMAKMDWQHYLIGVLNGIRFYIHNENEQTLPAARRKMFYFWLGHRLIQFCFLVFCFWILSKLLFMCGDLKAYLKEPILMPSEVLRNST